MPHIHRLAGFLIVCAVLAGIFMPPEGGHSRPARQQAAALAAQTATAAAKPKPKPSPSLPATAPAAAAYAHANELGQIPVLMYHRIIAKPTAQLDRTPAQLRAELTSLAKGGYVPITAADFVSGRIDIPAGMHPVVLTFDDGSVTQFAFDNQGNPAPDTAVSVLLEVGRTYPSFRPVATFFVNQNPFNLFQRSSEAVRWLSQHGFEIGNHTTHHPQLSGMTKEEVQSEIGSNQKMIIDLGAPPPTTFAIPYGALKPSQLSYAQQGTSSGASWDFAGMFLAGWKPALSPFDKDFDPRLINRIRSADRMKQDGCEQYCSTAWLDWLDKHPDQRYTSDGDPRVISFPAAKADQLAKRFAALGRPY